VSYDLGVQGDYPGIYSWLDEHQATECGDNLAFLNYEYAGSLLEALTADLKRSVETTKRTRYLRNISRARKQENEGGLHFWRPKSGALVGICGRRWIRQ